MDQDKQLLVDLWTGLQDSGFTRQTDVQMTYMMFHLKSNGFAHDQADVEQTLARWTNYRPGQDIPMKKLDKLFVPAGG